MSDPQQLVILKLLTAHLETQVTGWEPDDGPAIVYALQGRVWRGRTVITADDAEDALSLLEAPTPDPTQDIAAQGGVLRNETWRILLQGFPKDDKRNPSDPAYFMKAAVTKALSRLVALDRRSGEPVFPDEYLLGKRIGSLTVGQGVVRPASQEVSRLAMFYIPLAINLQTDLTNP